MFPSVNFCFLFVDAPGDFSLLKTISLTRSRKRKKFHRWLLAKSPFIFGYEEQKPCALFINPAFKALKYRATLWGKVKRISTKIIAANLNDLKIFLQSHALVGEMKDPTEATLRRRRKIRY